MRRGPKAHPTQLKRLRGTFRADRHRGLDPVAPGLLIDPPTYLSEPQRRRFLEILAHAPKNLLRQWDAATLAGIAESVVIETNEARQREEGNYLLDVTEKGQLMISALLKLQARYLPIMKSFGELQGFSPAARASLKLDDGADLGNDPEDDRWAEIARLSEKIKANDERLRQSMQRKRTRKAQPAAELVTLPPANTQPQ